MFVDDSSCLYTDKTYTDELTVKGEKTAINIRRMCFEAECIMALQGHPRSLILAPIESAHATSYWLSIVTFVLGFRNIAGFLLRRTTSPLFHPNFGVFLLD